MSFNLYVTNNPNIHILRVYEVYNIINITQKSNFSWFIAVYRTQFSHFCWIHDKDSLQLTFSITVNIDVHATSYYGCLGFECGGKGDGGDCLIFPMLTLQCDLDLLSQVTLQVCNHQQLLLDCQAVYFHMDKGINLLSNHLSQWIWP